MSTKFGPCVGQAKKSWRWWMHFLEPCSNGYLWKNLLPKNKIRLEILLQIRFWSYHHFFGAYETNLESNKFQSVEHCGDFAWFLQLENIKPGYERKLFVSATCVSWKMPSSVFLILMKPTPIKLQYSQSFFAIHT